ncbi:NAD-dependent DNA ligase LigA [Candidatus Deianiraea vastatrix]|uniref:DNA ligase n=1 Tax=Candidatus Deianiraea vastatrix TaxID=2163644 RepID=A0A5B8XEB9_9RICK|nr:NAD-dependent DNA ligase LigA [Candidatus Deianiraea vastatrix]QED23316.1 DNA ligase [Candidatus Deianiraea vastatrix]
MKQKNKEISKLKAEIEKHNRLYYSENSPEISDYDYDLLKKKLENLLAGDEDLFGKTYMEIGYTPSNNFAKIEHKIPMLSLDNAFDENDVMEFEKKIRKFLGHDEDLFYTAELKIDGLSFCAIYKNGILDKVSTRGDGKIGEDITKNAITIDNFPQKLDNPPEFLEIRGEIYLSRSNFEKLIQTQIENGEKPFANSRNAASGSLRVLDSQITKNRNLSYFAYNIAQISDDFAIQSQSESLELLKKLGFRVNDVFLGKAKIDECLKFYDEINKKRYEIDYDIDGIVYKVDEFILQNRLGNTSKSPRWAIAHKFAGNYAISQILSITNQVGRLGNITPVANLTPINIGGVVVSRATLHNYDEIARLGVSDGDLVKVTRAGDVVPRVVEVIEKKSDKITQIPQNCPCCNSVLVKDEDLVAIKCENPSCDEQIIQKIIHFASKDALNIEGLGKKQIERFYDLKIITDLPSIFRLFEKKETILSLDRTGEKSFSNMINSIDKAKNTSLAKFFYSLSIRHIGETVSEILAKYFQNINNFLNQITNHKEMYEKLKNVDGIGEKMVIELCNFIKIESNVEMIKKLCEILNIADYIEKNSTKYSGMKIVFTGTLTKMTRQEAKNTALKLGFEVSSAVSKNTNFLVAGMDCGSKLKDAQNLGVKILSEDDWLEMTKMQ